MSLQVIKRDGTKVEYFFSKIIKAVQKAGLTAAQATKIAQEVDEHIGGVEVSTISVEAIQDLVEQELMTQGFHAEAKAYILYRAEHAKLREGFPDTIDGEPFGYKEMKSLIEEVSVDLDVSTVLLLTEVKSHLGKNITQSELLANLVEACKRLCTPDNTDWSIMAGRWLTLERHAQLNDMYFIDYFIEAVKDHWKHDNFKLYNDVDIYACQEMLRPEKDFNHSFASVEAAHKKYLHKKECLHHMFMGNAMVIAAMEPLAGRMKFLREVYESLSDRKISLATPWVIGLRAGGNISSCFIIAPEDNLKSIMHNIGNEAFISAAGGGVGIAMSWCRAKGSSLMGIDGAATGVIGWCKIENDVAIYVNQGGKRAGAVTVALPVWHADIEDFLEIQTELGDLRSKCYDIEPQILFSDLFMQQVVAEGEWHTFCPYEVQTVLGIRLPELFGHKFDIAYSECVLAREDKRLKVGKIYKAKDLLKNIMARQFETGMPYIAFIDEINKHNPNKHEGIIPCVNLCVAPETLLLTDAGHLPIGELEGQKVSVWNGYEWSEVDVVKTGTDQKIYTVTTDGGYELECTDYHKWYIGGGREGEKEKRTFELSTGDRLVKFELPIIEGNNNLDYAYDNGFFSGDGNVCKGVNRIYLYHKKRELTPHLHSVDYWYDGYKQKRYVGKTVKLRDKFFVPDATYSISARLEWLAGFSDADGTVARNGTNESIQLGSIDEEFLRKIQFMLQTLGVMSKLTKSIDAAVRLLPRNKGIPKETMPCFCQAAYRLLISSTGLYKLYTLGFRTHRLKWNARKPQRCAEQFVRIVSVEYRGRISDTFCVTEPKRNRAVFNGILTGQCVESFSVVKPDVYNHCCNLGSLVVGRISEPDLEKQVRILTRILDNGIDLSKAPTRETLDHNRRYRTIGLGIQGLHDKLVLENKSYNDLEYITGLAERIMFFAIDESIELARERGFYPAFKGSEWDNGNMIAKFKANSVLELEWDLLQDRINRYGIRNSQLFSPPPNSSTSILMDACAGIMPNFAAYFVEDNAQGKTPVFSMHLKTHPLGYAKSQSQYDQVHLTKVVGALQKFVDTGISAEYIFDPDRVRAKDLYDLIVSAWKEKTKAIYYIRTDKNQSKSVCVGCAG